MIQKTTTAKLSEPSSPETKEKMTNFYVTCIDCGETNDQGINWGGEQIKRIAAAWPALRAVLDLKEEAPGIFGFDWGTPDVVSFMRDHERHHLIVRDEYGGNIEPLQLTGITHTIRRFAITKIDNEDGGIVLAFANQGRNHFDTRDAAETHLAALRANNSAHSLNTISDGQPDKLAVHEIECYPNGDAIAHGIRE
jgi:hypothetical protein